jgi:hypothetical protein
MSDHTREQIARAIANVRDANGRRYAALSRVHGEPSKLACLITDTVLGLLPARPSPTDDDLRDRALRALSDRGLRTVLHEAQQEIARLRPALAARDAEAATLGRTVEELDDQVVAERCRAERAEAEIERLRAHQGTA